MTVGHAASSHSTVTHRIAEALMMAGPVIVTAATIDVLAVAAGHCAASAAV